MRVLICPDKFKGSLSAHDVCSVLERSLSYVDSSLDIVCHPLADGGDGSIEILKSHLVLDKVSVATVDPLSRPITTEYYKNNDAAFIELADASGLVLLGPNERNPLKTSTIGTGFMIRHAIENGAKVINLFIGGSATNDGGMGIVSALGYTFLDDRCNELKPIGENLSKIKSLQFNGLIDFDDIKINILCDVQNPMYGRNGAAHVYASQKGANSSDIIILDNGLKHYAETLSRLNGRDISQLPGIGAAGAVGASLVGLLNANLLNGFEMIAKNTELYDKIKNADVVITGEGRVDKTSFQGKVVGNVLSICHSENKPCIVVGGEIAQHDYVSSKFFYSESIMSVAKSLDEAMNKPEMFLSKIGDNIGKNVLKLINANNNKMLIFNKINDQLVAKKYSFERVDFNRPWGGFFVLNEVHKQQFIDEYFDGQLTDKVNINMKLSPKILIVAPDKRLSWQYHHRRSEIWQVIDGTVGVIRSDTDTENEMQIFKKGDRIELSNGERHRLIGLDDYGVVAEIWVHEDSENPSDEDDIVRLQDDFGRR